MGSSLHLILILNLPSFVFSVTPFLDDAAFSIVADDMEASAFSTPRISDPADLILLRGAVYDITTGIFKAPYDGTYVLFYHSYTVPGGSDYQETILRLSDPDLPSGVVASDASDVNMILKVVVLPMKQGATVQPIVLSGEIHATVDTPFLFNGFLLYHDCIKEDCCEIPVRQSTFSGVVTVNIPAGHEVIDHYNVVLANIGGDFDPASGTFNVRLEGLYYLTFTAIISDQSQETQIDLQVNGGKEAGIRARTSGTQEPASVGVILPLTNGDVVQLVNLNGSPALEPPKWITLCFSGFLL